MKSFKVTDHWIDIPHVKQHRLCFYLFFFTLRFGRLCVRLILLPCNRLSLKLSSIWMISVFFFSSLTAMSSVLGQESNSDTLGSNSQSQAEPVQLIKPQAKIELLDFKDTDLRDVIRSIAAKYNLNIIVEDGITTRVTLHLVRLPVHEALEFIAQQYELVLKKQGAIYRISKPVVKTPPLDIYYKNARLSINVENAEIGVFVKALAHKSGKNVVMSRGDKGTVSGFLQNLSFEHGLRTLMDINGFSVRESNGIFLVERPQHEGRNNQAHNGQASWVAVKDSLVSLHVTRANIRDVLKDIFQQAGKNMVMYNEVKGEITVRCSNIPFDDALGYLLKGTTFGYRNENGIYLVGGNRLQSIASSQLVRLKHLRVDKIVELLPESVKKEISFKVIKEHNGFVVIGTQEAINSVINYIREIDRPVPQVLIEALVVDINRDDRSEFSINAGLGAVTDTSRSLFSSLFPVIDISATGARLNDLQTRYNKDLGLSRILKLPTDFYLRIKALEQEQKINVRSRPQIATISGHTASISIGTTQYFILKTETPIPGANQVILQESQRFETIKAEMTLEVTPWVTANGEIITEIHPEFSTPKGSLNSNVPPTIDHRILNSTVRLKDGETIILGGLIQESEIENVTKVPILGDIPLLGKLFRNRSHSKIKSELVIYLTPHIYYGGDDLGTLR